MDTGRKFRVAAFVTVLIAVSVLALYRTNSDNTQTAMVVRVIDGDTIVLDDNSTVRLLGINAPEHDAFYFEEAKNALKRMVENNTIRLEKDVDNNDQYGRLLRHVFVGDTFVNLELMKNGYANSYIVKPDVKYQDYFLRAEDQAKLAGAGIWKLSKYAGCISVKEFHYLEKNKNPDDEYVVFTNICNYSISLFNWTVKDDARHTYSFKGTSLKPNMTVTLNSGSGKDNGTKLFWKSKTPIWNNDGDTLYLRDEKGYLALNYTIGK